MIGEEFGIIACLAIAILYMTIVARVLIRLLHEEDKFLVLATAGLVCQFGLQALINMAVNVHIAPSKGMTLPFISYGGSSMVALSIGFGPAARLHPPQPLSPPLALCREVERPQMSMSRHYVLAAGGTGGHMIPAHALAEELMRRGHRVALITDDRGARIPGLFDKVQVHILPAGRLTGGPARLAAGGAQRSSPAGRWRSRLYETFRPSAVIGFGGYPALARSARGAARPHPDPDPRAECGARPGQPADGRARSTRSPPPIPRSSGCPARRAGQGPSRRQSGARRGRWRCATSPSRRSSEDGIFRLLVTGGSQGASILSEVVPEGLALLPEHFRRRLQVTQQCRAEDIEQVRARYAALGIPADLATYLPDLPDRLAWSHLVIARAGASTIAELTAAGRPAILVPLPIATDDHQTANAREMARAGGARTIAAGQVHPGRARQADAEARRSSPRRSPMPRRAPGRSAGPTRRATSPTWSSGPAAHPGADPAVRARRTSSGRCPNGVPA